MNILNCIGNTPFVKVKNLEGHAFPDIFVKLEEFNAGGSIKSRVALHMIEEAERTGRLSPGDTLIEATGGNTGFLLAVWRIRHSLWWYPLSVFEGLGETHSKKEEFGKGIPADPSRIGRDTGILSAIRR